MKTSGGRVAPSVLREGHIETTAEYKTAPSIVGLGMGEKNIRPTRPTVHNI